MTDQITAPEEKPARAPRATKAAAEPTLPRDIISIVPLIREELGAIGKNDEATAGARFKYRGHDEIVNAIVPLFNKYGVFTTVQDEHLVYQGRPAANAKWATAAVISKTVTFWAPDGSSVSSTIVAESVDNGNKATSQAQTYAYRIALTQTFTIPTGEPDPDSVSGDHGVADAPAAAPVQPRPVAPSEDALTTLRESIKAHLKEHGIEGKDPVLAAGKAFFNGREGFWENAGALTRWQKALAAGELPAKN